MDDTISRKAAIDALGKDPGFKVRLFGKSYDEGRSDQWFRDVYKLTTVPSAQPYTDAEIQKIQGIEQAQFDKIRELAYQDGKADAMAEIIRCRDCKHYTFADNRSFGFPAKRCEWTGFEDVDDDDFCSRAERREVSK